MANWRYLLIVLTVFVFAVMSAIFLKGSVFVVANSLKNPSYENSTDFLNYARKMNLVISVPAVLLVLLLVVCLQLRDSAFKTAGYFAVTTLVLSLIALFVSGARLSIGIISVLSFAYQLWLLFKLMLSGDVVSEKEFRIQKAGSLLLHAGFSLLLLSWVTLSRTELEIPVFYASTALVSFGMLLSFLPLRTDRGFGEES